MKIKKNVSKNLLTFLVLAVLFFSLMPGQVNAQGLVPCGGPDQPACQLCHFFVLFDNIVRFLLIPCDLNSYVAIVPLIAILMVVIGGVMFFAAVGDPAKIGQATSLLRAVAIGLVIIYGAYLLVSFFFLAIGAAELSEGWFKIDCPIVEDGVVGNGENGEPENGEPENGEPENGEPEGITCPENLSNHPYLNDDYLFVRLLAAESGNYPTTHCPSGYERTQYQECIGKAESIESICPYDDFADWAYIDTTCCKKQPPAPGDFETEEECLEAGFYWYNNTCHEEPESIVPSDFDNPDDCEEAGFYWYNNTCHEEPEYTIEIVLNAKNTRPSSMSCNDYCKKYFEYVTLSDNPATCESIGTNSNADNGLIMLGNMFGSCWTEGGSCNTEIKNTTFTYTCDGNQVQWTRCKCKVPN